MSKKTELVKDALIDLKEIQSFLKENSENMVKPLIEGSVQKGLKKLLFEAEYDEESADDTEKDKEEGVEDTETTETEPEVDVEPEVATEPEGEETTEIEPEVGIDDVEGADADGEDFDFSQFDQSEDGEYDLTNADTDQLIKVFKLVSGNDQVVIDDLGDGKIQLKDNETGGEYLITTQGEPEVEVELNDDPIVSEGKQECYENNEFEQEPELEIELGPEEEGEGLVDEKNMTQSYGVNRRAGVLSQTRAEYAPGANKRNGGTLVGESKKIDVMKKYYEKKINEMVESHNNFKKNINEENTKLKETLGLFRDKLKENAVVNNSLGKFVKLVIENSTTDVEKAKIFGRFVNEVKTIEDGNNLYESIKKELNGKPAATIITEKQFSAENSKKINEQVVYEDKNLSTIKNLMERVDKALA